MPALRRIGLFASSLLILVSFPNLVSAADPGFPTLTKTGPATVNAGQQFNYGLVFVNPSFRTAVVSDALPANTRFVSLVVNPAASWNCATPPAGSNGTVTCTRIPVTPPPETTTFTITVRVCAETVCDTDLIDQAQVAFGDPPQTVLSNTITTRVSALADLSIGKTGPATADAGANINYTIEVANLGPSNSVGTTVTDTLPAGWTVVSANSTLGGCFGVGTGVLSCDLGVLGAPAQCATSAPTTATINVVVHIPAISPPGTFSNGVSISNLNCLPDPAPGNNSSSVTTQVFTPNLGPGEFFPPGSSISGTKAGSVLFYNFYISNPADPFSTNTRIAVTNVNPSEGALLHFFFIDGATCSVANRFLCLTPNQTLGFLMSDVDPGTSGYLIVIAVDGPFGTNTGCPISFNYLIGHSSIKLVSSPRREAELEAEACDAQYGSPLPGCTPSSLTATLNFDGSPTGYNRLPRVLAMDSIGSRAEGNDTMLVLNRIGGNLTVGGLPLGPVFGVLFDDSENPHSFSFTTTECQFRSSLTNSLPRTSPQFEQLIPAGHTGWLKLWAVDEIAILGASLTRNDNTATANGAFAGAHNLHKLRLLSSVSLTVPIIPPSC